MGKCDNVRFFVVEKPSKSFALHLFLLAALLWIQYEGIRRIIESHAMLGLCFSLQSYRITLSIMEMIRRPNWYMLTTLRGLIIELLVWCDWVINNGIAMVVTVKLIELFRVDLLFFPSLFLCDIIPMMITGSNLLCCVWTWVAKTERQRGLRKNKHKWND